MNIRDKALENANMCREQGWAHAAEGWEAMADETGEVYEHITREAMEARLSKTEEVSSE